MTQYERDYQNLKDKLAHERSLAAHTSSWGQLPQAASETRETAQSLLARHIDFLEKKLAVCREVQKVLGDQEGPLEKLAYDFLSRLDRPY